MDLADSTLRDKKQPAIPERPLQLSGEENSRLTILPRSNQFILHRSNIPWNIPISQFIPFPSNNAPLEDVLVVFEEKTKRTVEPSSSRNNPLNWNLSRVFIWFVAKECVWTIPFQKNGQRTNISFNQTSASLCVMLKLEAHLCVYLLKGCCIKSHKPWPILVPTETCCISAAKNTWVRDTWCQVQFSALGSCFLRSVEARQLLYGPVEWDEINQPHWVTMGFSSFPWNP